MPPTLHIRLLGDFSLIYGDTLVAGVNTPHLHSLLAYLVLHRDAPQLRQQHRQALAQLIQLLETRRDYAALNNDRTGALRAYHACVTALQRELGVEPSLPTREAYERLLQLDSPAALERQPLLDRPPGRVGAAAGGLAAGQRWRTR